MQTSPSDSFCKPPYRTGISNTSGHSKARLFEAAVMEGLDHLLDFSGNSAYGLDVGMFEQLEERIAYGTANDDPDSMLLQYAAAFKQGNALQRQSGSHGFFTAFGFEQQHLVAGIQNR